MTTKARLLFVGLILLLAAAPGARPSLAQTDAPVFFPETGHWVKGDFLTAFQKVEEPLRLYGYPVTEAYPDRSSGRTIQYFQKARFEYHPQAVPELRVQLSPLGEYLYTPGPEVPIPDNFPACRLYEETGFQVCYAFLEFFNANGGVAQFGYPLSNFETHDERIVQYFQRSRFEWHPEYSPGQRVTLTDLGMRYFNFLGENPILLLPELGNNLLPTTLQLRVRAFPQKAVTLREGRQTIYVVVQDQNWRPVPNAQVEIVVTQQSGKEEKTILSRTVLDRTNDHGITQYAFPFTASSVGMIKVKVMASYDTLQEQTVTSFRVWW